MPDTTPPLVYGANAAKIVQALTAVRTGEVVQLNLPLDGPPVAGRPALRRTVRMHNQVRPVEWGGFVVVNDDLVEFALQGSTHWDAFAHVGHLHVGRRGVFLGDRDLTETFPEPHAKTLGVEALGPAIVTRGILLDFVATLGGGAEYLEEDVEISADDVRACLATEGVETSPGDALLVYTGFESRLEALGDEFPVRTAGLAGDTVGLLGELRVAAVAADNVGVEATPPKYTVHIGALCDLGIALGEMFALRELAVRCREDGRYDFLLVSVPLNLPHAFGTPANAVAIR